MKNSSLIKPVMTDPDKMDELLQSMELLEDKLDREILAKQQTIARQEEEIQRLHKLLEEKNKTTIDLNTKLVECMRSGEGNRQLINKLLGDIDRLNQDIEWYKRTYEKRSLIGTIKEKLFRK